MSDTEFRRRALAIFDEIADLEPAQREQRLHELCGDDGELRTRVQALLDADAGASEPFSGNAVAWSNALATGSPPDAMAGRSIGAWKIVGIIGHGGMGAVYAVERSDGAYTQQAALKLIRASADSPAARERFLRERQILAGLRHPNIASLLDGGISANGEPYFVMERVDGVPIDRWCDEHRLDIRGRVELFLQVLDAVRYAHRNLVMHRDLKPSNLLVDVDCRVKLLDFGIAKQMEGSELTVTVDRALTFEYASPEQLHDAPVTTATDIWQLGVVLHRLLSGSHPFGLTRETPVANQLQQLEHDPEPLTRAAAHASPEQAAERGGLTPWSLSRTLRGSLADIVQTCLRRDPEQRYASADALANDLRAWLDDRPIAAVPLSRGERAKLWLRRNRALAASAGAIAVALLAGTGVALWQANEARRSATLAGAERRLALTAQQRAEQHARSARSVEDAMVHVLWTMLSDRKPDETPAEQTDRAVDTWLRMGNADNATVAELQSRFAALFADTDASRERVEAHLQAAESALVKLPSPRPDLQVDVALLRAQLLVDNAPERSLPYLDHALEVIDAMPRSADEYTALRQQELLGLKINALRYLGRYRDAAQVAGQRLVSSLQAYGAGNMRTQNMLTHYAEQLKDIGQLRRAGELYSAALGYWQAKHFGSNARTTARLLAQTRRYADDSLHTVLPQMQAQHDAERQALGKMHARGALLGMLPQDRYISATLQLAQQELLLGDIAAATAAMNELNALPTELRANSVGHIAAEAADVAWARNDIARSLHDADAAVAAYRNVVGFREGLYPMHARLLRARALAALGRGDEAASEAEAVLVERAKYDQVPFACTQMTAAAEVLRLAGRNRRAVEVARTAVNDAAKQAETGSYRAGIAQAELGFALQAAGDAEAPVALHRADTTLARVLPAEHPLRAKIAAAVQSRQ